MTTIETGAKMLRMDLHPHQIALGDMLDARIETTAICWPRRAGKTTSTWAWMLGRCETVPDQQWITTAQKGTKARDRFMAVARTLERFYPQDDGGPRIFRGAGHEALEWKNGSRLSVVAPKGEAFRGDGANVYVDEPQELAPAVSEDLRQGALPLLDTLEDGQIILSGTPGKIRAGWFWDALEAGRRGAPGYALSEYAAPEHADPEDEEVWKATHPGIGTLTTLEKMRARREGMSLHQWTMEYLGWWPPDLSTTALDLEAWARSEVPVVARPDRPGLAFDVAPDGSSAALMAGWRDEGVAYLGVLDHRHGTSWLPRAAADVASRLRVPVRYDAIGANHGVAAELGRMRGVTLVSSTVRDAMGAAQRLASDIAEGRLRHFGQSSLTAAAEGAAWRQTEGGRLFARKASAQDVCPLVAGSLALWQFDQTPARQPVRIVTSNRVRA